MYSTLKALKAVVYTILLSVKLLTLCCSSLKYIAEMNWRQLTKDTNLQKEHNGCSVSRGSGPYPQGKDVQHLSPITNLPIHTAIPNHRWVLFYNIKQLTKHSISKRKLSEVMLQNFKHTHTLTESKWVNLVKKVGPVPLTRFPRTQMLNQMLRTILYSSAKMSSYNEDSNLFYKIPCYNLSPLLM